MASTDITNTDHKRPHPVTTTFVHNMQDAFFVAQIERPLSAKVQLQKISKKNQASFECLYKKQEMNF